MGSLAGRLCLVSKVLSVVHLVHASLPRELDAVSYSTNLHANAYWRGGEEKSHGLLLSLNHLSRFVVSDAELYENGRRGHGHR